MLNGRPLVAILKRTPRCHVSIWAFRLSLVDAGGHVVFETIAGLHDERGGLRLDAEVERFAAQHHEAVLAAASASLRSWVDLTIKREDAIIDALYESHARLSVALVQPGLFDRRAERAAAAQAARVEEAVQKSRVRLATLARLLRLRTDERTVVFGAAYRS